VRTFRKIFGPLQIEEDTWRVLSNAEVSRHVNGADIVKIYQTLKDRMVKPHIEDGLHEDVKKNNIRMETNGEAADRKTKNKMAG
jgi:hypothetical protein